MGDLVLQLPPNDPLGKLNWIGLGHRSFGNLLPSPQNGHLRTVIEDLGEAMGHQNDGIPFLS